MRLYQSFNGFIGDGPVYCFIWANNKEEAQELAVLAFQKAEEARIHGERFWTNIQLTLIVDTEEDTEPFYTEVED